MRVGWGFLTAPPPDNLVTRLFSVAPYRLPERKRRETAKCEGRKSHVELRPQVVREAKKLRRASPLNGERRSFHKISEELAAKGHLTRRGTPFSASAVQAMVKGPMPPKETAH